MLDSCLISVSSDLLAETNFSDSLNFSIDLERVFAYYTIGFQERVGNGQI